MAVGLPILLTLGFLNQSVCKAGADLSAGLKLEVREVGQRVA